MEKVITGFSFLFLMVFFILTFFFGNQYFWGIIIGLLATSVGMMFLPED